MKNMDTISAKQRLREVHKYINTPFQDMNEIYRRVASLKTELIYPFLKRIDVVDNHEPVFVGFIMEDYFVIGFYKKGLWTEDLVRTLEEFLDLTYKEDKFYYDENIPCKKFLINNVETEES